MYAAYFGLKREPFSIAPDPRYLFMSERHREALAHLLYGVGGGGGFVLLSGAVGAGKTTVCRGFLQQLPAGCDVAYVFNPKLSVRELLKTVCDEFGIAAPARGSVKDYVDPLNDFLLASHAAGRSSVLVIDEAQNLSAEVLEQLRLLTNLETDTRKLLQIILIGQPELRDKLAAPGLEQLAQRVIARYHLEPLGAAETPAYVRHRLAVAGLAGAPPFDDKALDRIHRHARGVPRRINLLCDRALLGAYAEGRSQVDAATVDRAAREVFDESPARNGSGARRAWAMAAGVAGVVALAVGLGWLQPPAADPAAKAAAETAARTAATTAANVAADPAPVVSAVPAVTAAAADSAASQAAVALPAAPSAPSAPPVLDAAALAARLPALWSDEADAWRALASVWGLAAGAGEPCAALAAQGLACYRGDATLAQIRQLDRPGWLRLQAQGTAPAAALLVGLGPQQAVLQLPDGRVTVSLATLATLWPGEFATLWRTPPGYEAGGPVRDGSALAGWLLAQLGAYQAGALPLDLPLRQRVEAFQRAQGLRPDGVAGPLTLMQLNRAVAVDEPRLTPER